MFSSSAARSARISPIFSASFDAWPQRLRAAWLLPLFLVSGVDAVAQPAASAPAVPPNRPASAPSQPVGALWQGMLDEKTSIALTIFRERPDGAPLPAEAVGERTSERRERVAGTVRYGPVPAAGRLLLEGAAPRQGRIDWRVWETGLDEQGHAFRREAGRLVGRLERDGRSIAGEWTGAGGAQPVPVSLRQAAQYREQVFQRDNVTLTERYPVTGDAAIDKLIQTMRMTACRAGMVECRNGIEIAWLDRERVSLLRTFWFFSGGAHGNSTYAAGNWRKTSQGYESVTLGDILDTTPACRDTLNRRLVDVLRRQGASQALAGALDDKAWRNAGLPFVWYGKGVVMYYAPYAVGPYVQGSFRAPVGFAQLGACVRGEPARQDEEKG